MVKVDLNADLGESFGNYQIGNDEEVLKYVTSANVACGFHAGDPLVMEKTIKLALENQVAIGAHPGFPDLLGFGRRNMQLSPAEARAYIIYQISALQGFVKAEGAKLQHVKPHGALYNMAAADYKLARAIAEGVAAVDDQLILVGLAGSELVKAGQDVGLAVASEVFADRAYNPDGSLAPRVQKGAVIADKLEAADRVIKMVTQGRVTAIDGSNINIKADTICVHGDNCQAVEIVKHIRMRLSESSVQVSAMGEI